MERCTTFMDQKTQILLKCQVSQNWSYTFNPIFIKIPVGFSQISNAMELEKHNLCSRAKN